MRRLLTGFVSVLALPFVMLISMVFMVVVFIDNLLGPINTDIQLPDIEDEV